MKTKAFTIFELLFVLVIILIVLAILFPVFARSRANRRSLEATCMHNEKQLGLGLLQYAQDNDEMLPDIAQAPGSPVTWRRLIFNYVKSDSVYQCPDRRDEAPGPDGLPRSYGANYSGNYSGAPMDQGNGAFAGPGSRPISASDYANLANLISLCEVAGTNRPEFNIDDPVRFGPKSHLLWAGHLGVGNYLSADGHVQWGRPTDTQKHWYRDATRPLSANGLAVLKDAQARAGR